VGVPVGFTVEVRVGKGVELGLYVVVGAGVELGEGADIVVITAVAVGLAILPASFSGCRLQLTALKINTHPRISPTNKFLNMGQLPIKSWK
jgi:hypothetical protein